MSKNYIGSTGIKKIFNLIKNKINSNLPFIGNFPNQKELLGTTKYTAEYNCWVFVMFTINNKIHQYVVARVGIYYVYQYQIPTEQEDLTYGFSIFLKKGDNLEILGDGLKSCNIYVHYK